MTSKIKFFLPAVVLLNLHCVNHQLREPQASGETPAPVQVQIISERETQIEMTFENLVEPEKVSSEARAFVVWIQQPGNAELKRAGTLQRDSFAKARFRSRIPEKEFRIIVTAEPHENISSPSGPIVMDQIISR